MGVLTVYLDKITNLRDADGFGKSDPVRFNSIISRPSFLTLLSSVFLLFGQYVKFHLEKVRNKPT